jgi:hypothetical protein
MAASQIDIAIPSFGYKNHVSIDQRFGFIRKAGVLIVIEK